jgi:cell division ATPase FtsA
MDNQIVSIPVCAEETRKKLVRNLASVINGRDSRTCDSEITMSGFKSKLIAGAVVTGGGAHLTNLVQLVEYVTGLMHALAYRSNIFLQQNRIR